jgi:hypothetical protein
VTILVHGAGVSIYDTSTNDVLRVIPTPGTIAVHFSPSGRVVASLPRYGGPFWLSYRVGTFHHVILLSKHQLMTASMVHVTI